MTFYQTLLVAAVPAFIGALITYLKIKQDFSQYKTEAMAEKAVTRLLKHEKWPRRSFNTIQNNLGGWDQDEDELRRILVRAGAVRNVEDNGEEWWHLLSRNKEWLRKKKKKRMQKKNNE